MNVTLWHYHYRGIRQRANSFDLQGEEYLYLKGTSRQWVPQKSLQDQIITACHDNELG